LSLDEFNKKWEETRGWEIEDGKKEILNHRDGPLWVVAGPGTGKTEALIIKTLRLLLVDGVRPESIFLTTFTEKGAEELEDRIADALSDFGYADEIDSSNIRTGTLHSLCNDIMREFRYPDYIDLGQMDEDDQKFFIRKESEMVDWIKQDHVYSNLGALGGFRFHGTYEPNKWMATNLSLELLNRTRQYLVTEDDLSEAEEQHFRELGEQVSEYRGLLQEKKKTDFAEIQNHFLDFLDTNFADPFIQGNEETDQPPLKYVLVDEYQDTNPLQEAIYFKLADACNQNITVVGDDDQALYRFRGGSVECMVRFGDKCIEKWGVEPDRVQLKKNYRSHKDIVDWVNRYISKHPRIDSEDRAGEKEDLIPHADVDGDYPAVSAIFGKDRETSAEMMAEMAKQMKRDGVVEDYSQMALLLRSARESPRNAEKFVNALEDRGIPVYNPRNKALTEQEEVQLALGCLIKLLDYDGAVREDVNGNFKDDVEDWIGECDALLSTEVGEELDDYLIKSWAKMDEAESEEKVGDLMEVFYRILSHEPFSSWKEEKPNRSKRIARVTSLLEAYSNVYSGGLYTTSSPDETRKLSYGWLMGFYYNFVQYVARSGFDEPEDPYDQVPEGFLQVMTVHQSKGLEFPIVFAGDIDKRDDPDGTHYLEDKLSKYSENISYDSTKRERADHDNIRRFYVQYSRAQNSLVLVGSATDYEEIALGSDRFGHPIGPEWFEERDTLIQSRSDLGEFNKMDVGSSEGEGVRRRYSVTGDILSYRRCARQYGYFTQRDYSPAGEAQIFFGQVVHRTLDRAHQQYKGKIENKPPGIPDEDDIEEYFDQVSESLKAQGAYPRSQKAEEKALEYVKEFNREKAEELYPQVKDTEHRLQTQTDDFVMEGTVDVLVRPEDDDGDPSDWEIWDYKATSIPEDHKADLDNYIYQMRVYAGLFKQKNGKLPSRAVLYFMGEDDPDRAEYKIDFDRKSIKDAMRIFESTVSEIEDHQEKEEWPAPSDEEKPSDETCSACDLRWDCPAVEGEYPLRTP
ncbi:MAG: UvrD-helicase domain-containing protein, partial [Candidatus Nanohaloarchaea archaeon]